jgi:cysteate synthase
MNGIGCLVIVPEAGLDALQFPEPVHPCVRIVSLGGFTDYFDAITLANRVAALDGFFPEGGVRNVARVDGLGTTMLSAVEAIGRLPHYYLQAIGSGAGGIGVYETARRVVADGRFGERLPRLLLSQKHAVRADLFVVEGRTPCPRGDR